ncbi:hypothetical protein V1499_11320 [Neobacillus sp. SCS-31]|uniref:hypothetical protein n=1 Tax=Neobacillus oceani TaxID=3115292 RepID=UPI003905794E
MNQDDKKHKKLKIQALYRKVIRNDKYIGSKNATLEAILVIFIIIMVISQCNASGL